MRDHVKQNVVDCIGGCSLESASLYEGIACRTHERFAVGVIVQEPYRSDLSSLT